MYSRRIVVLLCHLLLVIGAAHADEPSDKADKTETFRPRAFEAAIRNGEIVGWEQTRRVFLTCGTNEFVFVVPQELRVTVNADKVTLASADSTYFLTLRVLNAAGVPDRGHVSDRFPKAQIIEEFSKSAAGRSGPAFDLRSRDVSGVERAVCLVFVPSDAGVLEFSVNADLSKSSDARSALNTLLRTFRSNESGKLEVIVRTLDHS